MKNRKIISIYLSGFFVGIALVLFPAAGTLFTNEAFHGLNSVQYGSIFIPQIILAIISAISAPKIADKIGMKKVMLFGLVALLISMLLLASSSLFYSGNLDYFIIMLATAFIGTGFGFTITALNPFAFSLFPGKETSAITAMHILLGIGTASASLVLNAFLNIDLWYAAPLSVAVFIIIIIILTIPLPLNLPVSEDMEQTTDKKIPLRIWIFAIAVFLYGACEATFGNFGTVFLQNERGLTIALASVGLAIFWGFVTIGRVIFTFVALRFSTRIPFMIAPFLVAIVFYSMANSTNEQQLFICMAMGGLGLSFLFPKSISAATEEFPKYAAFISGALVASIQLGTGFSSNIIGILNEHYSLSSLIQFSAIYALLLGLLLIYLNVSKKKNNS